MTTKNDLLDAMLLEIQVLGHLAEKAQASDPDYRPTPEQRSTLETFRYAAFCGIGATCAALDNSWERYKEWSAKTENLTMAQIPEALEEQANALRATFEELSDEQLATQETQNPIGKTLTLNQALLDMPLRWLTGYRMQAFLYLKSSGQPELTTPNCWYGFDPEPK